MTGIIRKTGGFIVKYFKWFLAVLFILNLLFTAHVIVDNRLHREAERAFVSSVVFTVHWLRHNIEGALKADETDDAMSHIRSAEYTARELRTLTSNTGVLALPNNFIFFKRYFLADMQHWTLAMIPENIQVIIWEFEDTGLISATRMAYINLLTDALTTFLDRMMTQDEEGYMVLADKGSSRNNVRSNFINALNEFTQTMNSRWWTDESFGF